jgi:hypothetical protein
MSSTLKILGGMALAAALWYAAMIGDAIHGS